MTVYEELNKVMVELRQLIAVAQSDAIRNEKSAEENLSLARSRRAEAIAYQHTLDHLSAIEFPK